MSEAERAHATRVHKLNCWQHMRNIFLNNMSKAQAKHVSEELKPWLDAFTSWERMTTDFDQLLLRAVYKIGRRRERLHSRRLAFSARQSILYLTPSICARTRQEFHHGNKYYKGKGREFWVWLLEHSHKVFAMHFERAEGGRQDLDYDAAVPMYIMRPYM
eukprot:4653551-Prymnesium_polylepis.3